MGFIDMYNSTMGDVDLSDQLRGLYRLDRWVRNRKWWWSMFFWGFGVLLTNAYVMYCKFCDENNVPKKDRRTHLEFRQEVAIAWIDEDFYFSYLQSRQSHRDCLDKTAYSPITLDSILIPSSSSRSSRSTVETNAMRNKKISDDALHPETGQLRCQLNKNLDHLPMQTTSKTASRCGFHRWLGYETCKAVSYCSACSVNLCLNCYKLFHHEEHLVGQKEALKKKLNPKPNTTSNKG